MSDALYTAFVEIRPDLANFDSTVRSQLGAIPAATLPMAVDSAQVGASATAAVEKAAPVITKAGESGGENAAKGFVSKFGDTLKSTLTQAVTFGLGFAGVAGVADFLKVGIDQNETYTHALNLLTTTLGQNAGAVQTWSDTQARAYGASQASLLDVTSQYSAVAQLAGQLPQQAADTAQQLDTITAKFATRSGENFDTARLQIQQFVETGQGRGLAKYVGKVSPQDLTAEAEKLGLIKPVVDPATVAAAQDKVAAAQQHLADITAKGKPDQEHLTILQREQVSAQAALTKAVAQHGSASLEAYSANTRLIAVSQQLNDALHPVKATATDVATAQQSVTTAQKVLTDAMAGSLPALDDTQRSLAAIGILQDEIGNNPNWKIDPLPTDKLRADFEDIAKKATVAILPTIDKLATFLDEHADQIGQDIGGVFTKVGDALGFIVAHKDEFLAVAAGFAVLHEIRDPTSAFRGILTDLQTAKGWIDKLTGHGGGTPIAEVSQAPTVGALGQQTATLVETLNIDTARIVAAIETHGLGGGLPGKIGGVAGEAEAVGGVVAAEEVGGGALGVGGVAGGTALVSETGTVLATSEAGLTALAPGAVEDLAAATAPAVLDALGIGAAGGIGIGTALLGGGLLAGGLALAFDTGGVRTALGNAIGGIFSGPAAPPPVAPYVGPGSIERPPWIPPDQTGTAPVRPAAPLPTPTDILGAIGLTRETQAQLGSNLSGAVNSLVTNSQSAAAAVASTQVEAQTLEGVLAGLDIVWQRQGAEMLTTLTGPWDQAWNVGTGKVNSAFAGLETVISTHGGNLGSTLDALNKGITPLIPSLQAVAAGVAAHGVPPGTLFGPGGTVATGPGTGSDQRIGTNLGGLSTLLPGTYTMPDGRTVTIPATATPGNPLGGNAFSSTLPSAPAAAVAPPQPISITIMNNNYGNQQPTTAADVQRGLYLAGVYDQRRQIAPQPVPSVVTAGRVQ